MTTSTNKIRDWALLQGMTHPTDNYVQPLRDLNSRYITIENSSERQVGIAITTYPCGEPTPVINFIMDASEVKHLGVNLPDEQQQYIHMLDPQSGKPVGEPTVIMTHANQFVLRDGLQGWFVHFFKRANYRCQF